MQIQERLFYCFQRIGMNKEYESNKGVQGTLHKVSGPLTPDVRFENDNRKHIRM